jgi:N-hydroxyarylamine O-acetyltransferase
MDVDAYLQRLDYHGSVTPNIETLRDLHLAHLMAVPFENLDIGLGRPIILDLDLLFDKVVRQRRGGFCYELNGLFGELLKTLGFKVEMLSSGVAAGDGTFGPDFDHMMLVITLDQRWLVDVGFGDAFREPLLLDETGEQVQGDRHYRIEHHDDYRTLCRQLSGQGWEKLYRFTVQARALADYVPMCQYQQTSPDSHFVTRRICSRATPDGQITLSDKHLIVTSNGQRTEHLVTSEEDFSSLLRKHFGIDLLA